MNDLVPLALFTAAVIGLLTLEIVFFHRRAHRIGMSEAASWSAFWIALSLAFCFGVYLWRGHQAGLEFLTAYVLEKSLSVDNLFVFTVLLSSYRIAAEQQHRVLGWGAYGALGMRAIFIVAGIFLIGHFRWVLFVFGGFIVGTGFHLLQTKGTQRTPKQMWALRVAQRYLPLAADAPPGAFFVRRDGRRYATPMLMALVTIEAADVLFALDSIPAVFGVTRDPFIAYTSNILAVLGMRSLYFVLAAATQSLRYLHYGVSAILIFIGAEMLVTHWVKLPVVVSLAVITLILATAVAASLARRPAARDTSSGTGQKE